MDNTRKTEDELAMLWNSTAGHAWVELQEVLDHVLKPFEDLLVEGVLAGSASQVLDVGCGAGSTTLAVARLLGSNGRCTGIDISKPMIDAAIARAKRENTPATFILADAQGYAFEPASFDMILSRFGIMFFADSVRAFANLKHAANVGARLRFIVWRGPLENPFMTTAERAAAPLLPNLPARQPDEPGQFAFADQRRVHGILEESGWSEIDIRPVDVPCTFPEKHLVRYLTSMGPVGRALQEVNDQTRLQVTKTVRAAFEPFVHGPEVRFNAACWLVCAQS